MYETHFGLRQRPFRTTPDSELYYPATSHEQALAQLVKAIAEDEGFALLTGGPGLGKTLVCHTLLERLGEETTSAFLTNSHFPDRAGLLQAILYDLSLPYTGMTEQGLRLALTDFLLENHRAGKRAVLMLDEAQNLSADLLEELRLLGNLEGRGGKAIQVILVAQPSLLELLDQPGLAALRQRLAVCTCLEPLGLHEAADFLAHHVRQAGGRTESLFSDEALSLLARGTGGIPRLLARAGHQALTVAHSADLGTVDAEVALEALTLLGLCVDDSPEEESDIVGRMPGDSETCAHREPTEVLAAESDVDAASSDASASQRDAGRLRRLFGAPRRTA